MNFATILLLFVVAFAVWRTNRSVQRCTTVQEKALAIRGAAVFWLLGFVFVVALIFLPNKIRILMMIPAFFVAISIARGWHNARARLRRQAQQRVDLEEMKRVN